MKTVKQMLSLALTVILVLSLCACGQKADPWQEQYDLGVRYLSDGNYEEAIIAFTAAIEIDPKRVDAYLGRGDAYIGSGDLDAAKADYEQAIELDEGCAEAYLGLAEFYLAIGDTARAEEAQNAARAAFAQRGVSMEGATLPQTARTRRENMDDGSYYIYEYDSAGNQIKEAYYNGDGTVEVWYIHEYDSANNLLKRTSYNADGTVGCWLIFEHDSAGNVSKQTLYNADGTVEDWHIYEYDSANNLLKRTGHNADGTVSYISEYDSAGNWKDICYDDGIVWRVAEHNADGTWKRETLYNADGTVAYVVTP